MTWGSEWGFTWGGESEAFDFNAMFLSHLWKQLDGATQLKIYLELMADILSIPDADAVGLISRVGIDAATGDELDDWGLMVGIKRNGMADALYRRAIKATARKVFGQGDPATIYDIVEIFTDGVGKATIVESFPARIAIWLHNLTVEEQAQVGALFDGVPGLGIGAAVVIVDPAGTFEWESSVSTVSPARHWSSSTGSVPPSERSGFASVHVIQ